MLGGDVSPAHLQRSAMMRVVFNAACTLSSCPALLTAEGGGDVMPCFNAPVVGSFEAHEYAVRLAVFSMPSPAGEPESCWGTCHH